MYFLKPMLSGTEHEHFYFIIVLYLHQVCIPAFSFSTKGSHDNQGEDLLAGHCAIGLEQLCKVAMVSTGGVSGCVTVTRMLVNQGKPMYNIDAKSLQVLLLVFLLFPLTIILKFLSRIFFHINSEKW